MDRVWIHAGVGIPDLIWSKDSKNFHVLTVCTKLTISSARKFEKTPLRTVFHRGNTYQVNYLVCLHTEPLLVGLAIYSETAKGSDFSASRDIYTRALIINKITTMNSFPVVATCTLCRFACHDGGWGVGGGGAAASLDDRLTSHWFYATTVWMVGLSSDQVFTLNDMPCWGPVARFMRNPPPLQVTSVPNTTRLPYRFQHLAFSSASEFQLRLDLDHGTCHAQP